MNRKSLYARIDSRCEAMMANGLLAEAERLKAGGLDKCPAVRKTIGYSHLFAVLEKRMSEEKALSLIQRDTRRYAKRQLTWFRGQRHVDWIAVNDPLAAVGEITRHFRRKVPAPISES